MAALIFTTGLCVRRSIGEQQTTRRARSKRGIDATVGPIDIALDAGDVCAISGPALSGKSALIGALGGTMRSLSGEVERADGRTSSIVPQSIALVGGLTVDDNIGLPNILGVTKAPAAAWRAEVIERLGLERVLHREPDQTSYGERYRTMLARSLCAVPDVILTDEPFDHQDPEMADEIAQLLLDYADRGHACITTLRRRLPVAWLARADVIAIDLGS